MDNKYAVGSPYHFEMEMEGDPEFDQIVRLLNGGKPDLISIDGVVVFNQKGIAVVRVKSRFLEFDDVVHSLEETLARFPGYKPSYTPAPIEEYLWIDTSIEGFGGFISNNDFYGNDDPIDVCSQ